MEVHSDCLCNEKICNVKYASKATLVFRGKVEKKVWFNTDQYILEVLIKESWKGIQSEGYVEILGNNSITKCDYDFKIGSEYLIYAYKNQDNLFAVSKYSPTIPWSEVVEEDLINLGKPAYEDSTK